MLDVSYRYDFKDDDVLEEMEDDLERDEVLEIEKDSAQQTSRVHFWRGVVTLGLAVTGITVTAWSYSALLHQETVNFENAYGQFSRTVGQAAVEEMLRLREAARIFASTMESTAQLTNTTWPLYDNYGGLGSIAKEQVSAKQMESIGYLTRVKHSDRQAYLDFQAQHYERWVKEGHIQAYGHLDILLDDENLYQKDILEFNPTDFSLGSSSDKDEYYPLAYRYPPPNSYFVINFDIRSINYDDMFASLLQLQNQTLLSNVNPFIEGDEAETRFHAQFHDQLPGVESKTSFPHSFLFHPVRDLATQEIAAVVTFPLAWDASLRRLLPDAVEGIIAVARNNCNQSVTYEIVGPRAFFLGWEDLHDAKYDDMEYVVNLDFSDHPQFRETPGHCAYSLSIYPSQRFEEAYKSTTPVTFVVVVGCTFALMIFVFFVYDGVVQHRNQKIVRAAARSNEIVTSMFPGALRAKIMNQKMAGGSSNITWNKKSKQLTKMLEAEKNKDALQQQFDEIVAIDNNEPLAEHYKETTVFFGDIVGFTQWSTSREPAEVFLLLETIFRAFDVLARQRKIFKVETVGDCYVAVAGFPVEQEDHAARMCRFAAQCLKHFYRLVFALEDSLGPGTGDLGLRIGLHSGPVTAGVLRGDRTRFQLFGDTMNTTQRIESTGEGGKIHLSHATAELVRKDGYGSWIVCRDDKVNAKGLGTIQTYFLKTSKNHSRRRPSPSTSESTSAIMFYAQPPLRVESPRFEIVQDRLRPLDVEQAPEMPALGGRMLSQILERSSKVLRLEDEVRVALDWSDELSL